MGIEKVIILLSITFSSLQLSETTRRRYFTSNNIRRNTFGLDDPNNCICFQRSEKLTLLPHLLDSRNHGYERLVVYFYKDRVTQEIKMYTPNADKQYLIPDLPFEIGDSLRTVTVTETIYNAINISPHRTILNNKQDVNVPHTDNNIHIVEPVTTSFLGDESVTAAPIGINIGKIETRPLHEMLPENENNHPDQIIEIKDVNSLLNGHFAESVSEVGTKVPGQVISGNIVNSFDVPNSINNVDQETDIQNPWQTKHTIGTHEYNWHEYNDISNKYNGTSVFDQYNNLPSDGYLTFDKWFQQQSERFHNMHAQGSFNTIDVETLRILIQQTLLKNNIFISTDGILTDSQGTIMDVSNLNLRPVLIGNSLAYENFMINSGSQFSLPTNMPYLEALVISLAHPPKMLGIIPMGKTYIPQVGGSVPRMKKWGTPKYIASTITKSQCNGKCETEVVSGKLPFGRSSGRRIIPGNLNTASKIKHDFETVKNRRGSWRRNPTTAKHVNKQRINNKELEPIIIDLKDLESNKETRRFPSLPLGTILQQVYKVIFGTSRRDYHEPGKDEKEYGEDFSYEDDKPDFRIIGGSAATGSGTPLSSRGRSGGTD